MKVELLALTILFSLLSCSLKSQVMNFLVTEEHQDDNNDEAHESQKSIINSPDAISKVNLLRGDCFTNKGEIGICYRDKLEDSRCPPRMQCKWAGNAKLDLELILSDSSTVRFELNTNHKFTLDTTINNTYILLEGLSQKGTPSSVANLLVANLENLECNAQIIGINKKSGCSYGYQIETGQDTIISNDHKIRWLLGDKDDFPIGIYVELGSEKKECRKSEGLKNYYLERVVATRN